MKIIISSSKTMGTNISSGLRMPSLIDRSNVILDNIKKLSLEDFSKAINIDYEKAKEYYDMYSSMYFDGELSKAVDSYGGVVFKEFKGFMDLESIEYMNNHLRIISALYGVLGPYDGIKKYRLEMNSKIKVNGKSIYSFWGDSIYREINDNLIINLASEEYAKCVRNQLRPNDTFIDMDFLVVKNGEEKRISTNVKKARGSMVRFLIKNRVEDISKLKDFKELGYEFDENSSNENKLVFKKYD